MGFLTDIWYATCGYILVPKFLIIENVRLGSLFRFLQVLAVVTVFGVMLLGEQWIYTSIPSGSVYNLWAEYPAAAKSEPGFMGDYCGDKSLPKFEYHAQTDCTVGQDNHCYKPSTCLDLPDELRWESDGSSVFIPTFVDETTTTYEAEHAKCVALEATCVSSGKAVRRFQRIEGTPTAMSKCSCQSAFHYFVENAEATRLSFHYRFRVSKSEQSTRMLEGSSNNILEPIAEVDQGEELEKNVLDDKYVTTALQNDAATHDSRHGHPVAYTIAQLIKAGGSEMNTTAPLLNKNKATEAHKFAPMRVVGGEIRLNIFCQQHEARYSQEALPDTSDGPVCDIASTVNPGIVQRKSVTGTFDAHTFTGFTRLRTMNGISVSFTIGGRFSYFSINMLITALTSSIVLLQIPSKLVMVFALFGLGLLSKIYYSSQSQRLNVRREVHGFAARMVNAKRSFQAIVSEKGDLSRALLSQEMYDAFHHLLKDPENHSCYVGRTATTTDAESSTGPNKIITDTVDLADVRPDLAEGNHESDAPSESNAEEARMPSKVASSKAESRATKQEVGNECCIPTSICCGGKPVDPRILEADELNKLTAFVYDGLDSDGGGAVEMPEYIDASTSNEVLRLRDVVHFFDDEREKGCMEKIFDDARFQEWKEGSAADRVQNNLAATDVLTHM